MRIMLLAAVVLALHGTASALPPPDDHASALAALADVRASTAEIVRIEDGYAVGHAAYVRAAHRALNALVGQRDDGYVASFGDPGDTIGTLGHLDGMLDRNGTSRWTPAIEGAKANVLAAAENLQSALHEKEMEDYQADLTRTLASLALVAGNASEEGVFGGVRGALANTTLGVPRGARSASACALPAHGPAYGVVAGRLAYVALPRRAASTGIPSELSISRVVVSGDDIVMYTYAARAALAACGHAAMQRTRAVAHPASNAPPFTIGQAHLGKAVYLRSCLQCHGANLQGTAGPSVAGTEFLKSAHDNGWTLSDLRTTVFENMPFSNPGSLTPKQYADVMAFLLAANCYRPGTAPFPQTAQPALAKFKIGPIHAIRPTSRALGTCAVK